MYLLSISLFVSCSRTNPEDSAKQTDTTEETTQTTTDSTPEPVEPSAEPGETTTESSTETETTTETEAETEEVDPAAREGWTLVWRDEFDATEIDLSKWAFEVNGQGGGNNELQYYTERSENARIENGSLVIEARAESYTGADGTRNYTSARLRTAHQGDWTYGRMEARIRLPEGQGIWPAFWGCSIVVEV